MFERHLSQRREHFKTFDCHSYNIKVFKICFYLSLEQYWWYLNILLITGTMCIKDEVIKGPVNTPTHNHKLVKKTD